MNKGIFLGIAALIEIKQIWKGRVLDLDKRRNILRKELEEKGMSDEAINREINEKINPSEAQESVERDSRQRVRKAQIGVDNALENWDKIKPKMVVSELGRVGGGSVFQIGGSGPTDLLKDANPTL